ncbi:MAG: hypothetical protein ABIO40_08925 [Devosia sp.]
MKLFAAALFAGLLLVPAGARAETSLSSYETVHGALLSLWSELPLTARNASLTEGPATGFGSFTPAPHTSFTEDEPIHVYVEVLGYGWRDKGDGTVAVELDADLMLMGADGVTLARQDKFLSTDIVSREKRLETFLAFEANLSGFAPGEYELRYRLTDRVTGKTTEFGLPITLSAAEE